MFRSVDPREEAVLLIREDRIKHAMARNAVHKLLGESGATANARAAVEPHRAKPRRLFSPHALGRIATLHG